MTTRLFARSVASSGLVGVFCRIQGFSSRHRRRGCKVRLEHRGFAGFLAAIVLTALVCSPILSVLPCPRPVTADTSSFPSVISTINVGGSDPKGIAVDPSNNRIYVANYGNNSVSVIDSLTLSPLATVAVGTGPTSVAVNPGFNRIYVANYGSNTISVIDGTSSSVISTIGVGSFPDGIAINLTANLIYVANYGSNTVSAIDGYTNSVVATINVGTGPDSVSVDTSTARIYVANYIGNTISVVDSTSNSVISTIGVGNFPEGIAVNSASNRIYVANYGSNTLSIIDGSTNSPVATVSVGTGPNSVSVDTSTNCIYVANYISNNVSVIDGTTNGVVSTIGVGNFPEGIAVNSASNRIYVANYGSNTLSIIDGSTNIVVSTVNLVTSPQGVAVNPTATRIYVANQTSNTVSVIDGADHRSLATVNVGAGPSTISVNPSTNRIYVANYVGNTVSVIDGSNNIVMATVSVGSGPQNVAVNPITDRIYVANRGSNTVSVIDGSANSVVTTIGVGSSPYDVAVNSNTNRIYVANNISNNVSVIDGNNNTVIATIGVGRWPSGVAVNPTTNRVFVANAGVNSMSVIDGSNNSNIATVGVGTCPVDVAVNPAINRIYVVNGRSNTVSVINGSTNGLVSTPIVGSFPLGVAVNPTTNRVFVANSGSADVSVMQDGTSLATVTTTALTSSVPTSNYGQSVTFTAAVSPVPDGGTIQLKANGISLGNPLVLNSSGQASYTTSVLFPGSHTITAIYSGNNSFAWSNGSLNQTINTYTNPITKTVPSNQPWIDTGIDLNQGDRVFITATGVVKIAGSDPGMTPNGGGPNYGYSQGQVAPTLPGCSLLGKIASGNPFEVGSSFAACVTSPGRLYLGINESNTYGDNSGSWTATIEVGRVASLPSITSFSPTSASSGTLITIAGANFSRTTEVRFGGMPSPSFAVDSDTQITAEVGNGSTGKVSVTTPDGTAVSSSDFAYDPASTTTNLVSSINPSAFGQPISFTATVNPGTASGTVQFSIDGSSLGDPVALSNGSAVSSTRSDLPPGDHAISASYSGDANHSSSAGNLTQTVHKAATKVTLTSNVYPWIGGQPVSITATVTPTLPETTLPTGNVTFQDGTTILGVVSMNSMGQASCTFTPSAGDHTFFAAYNGDANYLGGTGFISSNGPDQQVVVKASVNTRVEALDPFIEGQPMRFKATLSPAFPATASPNGGTVQFWVDGILRASASVSNGTAVSAPLDLTPTDHDILAEYSGDSNYWSSTGLLYISIDDPAVSYGLESSANPAFFSQPVTFTYTVGMDPPVYSATGTVIFTIDGIPLAPVTVSNGVAVSPAITDLSIDNHNVTADYSSGDSHFPSRTIQRQQAVLKIPTWTVISSSQNPSNPNNPVVFTATVNKPSQVTLVPTGTVQFQAGGDDLGGGYLASGAVSSNVTSFPAVGLYNIAATYTTDSPYFYSSSGSLQQSVVPSTLTSTSIYSSSPNSSCTYGAQVTFTATVSELAPASGIPTGTVQFLDNGMPLAQIPLDSGVAVLSTSSLKIGRHTIVAVYSGNSECGTSSGELAQMVNASSPIATQTNLTSSVNPSVYSQPVTFTSTVISSAPEITLPPGGTVTFTDTFNNNTTTLATVALSSSGVAAYTTSTLSVGSHNIVANYSGDSNFASSAAYLSADAVVPEPTIVSLRPGSGLQGQSLPVIITGTNFGSVPATGAVTFGSGIRVDSYTLDSDTQITASITISGSAAVGARDVSVTTLGGTATKPGGFTVNAAVANGWHEQSTVSNSVNSVRAGHWVYQTFTPSVGHNLNTMSLNLFKYGSPNYTVTMALYNVDGDHKPVAGAPLCSMTFAASSLSKTATWRTFSFPTGCQVSAGTEYALVLSGNGGSTSSYVAVRMSTADPYSGGLEGKSTNGGSTWDVFVPAQDIAFREAQFTEALGWYEQYTVSNSANSVRAGHWVYQTFTPSAGHYFNAVSLNLYKYGSPNYTVTIALYNVDGDHKPVAGAPLCSTTFAASSLTATPTWRSYNFSTGCQLTAGTEYALVLSGDGGSTSSYVAVRMNSADGYSGGLEGKSTNGGSTWEVFVPAQDISFREGQY